LFICGKNFVALQPEKKNNVYLNMKKEKHNVNETEQNNQTADNVSATNQELVNETEAFAGEAKEDTPENNAGAINSEINFEEQVAEWKDKYVRLSAEFDNYRKRTLREKADLIKYAGENTMKDLLPIIDDFERAMKNIELATDIDAIKEGIFLINGKFKDFLSQKGLKQIEALNVDFNTDFHEAITKIPVEDKSMSGKIIDVVQTGYMLDEKVVRYAKVVIGE
jgi:molecular chaperone GrpE